MSHWADPTTDPYARPRHRSSSGTTSPWESCLIKVAALTDVSYEDPDFLDLRDDLRRLTVFYGNRIYPQTANIFSKLLILCDLCLDGKSLEEFQSIAATFSKDCTKHQKQLKMLARQHGFIVGYFRNVVETAETKKSGKVAQAKDSKQTAKKNHAWATGIQAASIASLLLVLPAPFIGFAWKHGNRKREVAKHQDEMAQQLRKAADGIASLIKTCATMEDLVDIIARFAHEVASYAGKMGSHAEKQDDPEADHEFWFKETRRAALSMKNRLTVFDKNIVGCDAILMKIGRGIEYSQYAAEMNINLEQGVLDD
jgi:hypothetical protein